MALDFVVTSFDDPQLKRTKWFARPSNGEPAFLVGYTVPYVDGDGPHTGISQSRVQNIIPRLYYNRDQASAVLGLWAHFIWPSVTAESAGHHLTVNTYDRARFTFGFYQLAAHTPNDNLILLFRALLALPRAPDYFPDLLLKSGKVHRRLNDTVVSLETITSVRRPNGKTEDQILGFMSYLNPDTQNTGDAEVRNAARLMHWLLNDPAALDATIAVSFAIMRRKIKTLAQVFGLSGKAPELAIWVSDIKHQGRGNETAVHAALAKPSLAGQLAALHAIGEHEPKFDGRRETVRQKLAMLSDERRFEAVTLGDAALPLI